MDLKVEGTCNTKKNCGPPWFAAKKSFWILDALKWLKQPSNSFYFETLSLFPLFLFLLFATQRSWGPCLPPHPHLHPHRCRRLWLYTKSRWEKRSHLSSYHVYSGSFMVIKMSKIPKLYIFKGWHLANGSSEPNNP